MPDSFDHLVYAMINQEDARRFKDWPRGREEQDLVEYHLREAARKRLEEQAKK